LVGVAASVVWLAARSETFAHSRARIADSDEKNPVESWASWAWIVSAVSIGFAAPIVFFMGARQSKRPWLVLAGVGSVDLLLLGIGLAGNSDNTDTATAIGTALLTFQWVASSFLILTVWIVTRARRRGGVVVALSGAPWAGDPFTWDEYVAAVAAPPDSWGYTPPPGASLPPLSQDKVPMERLAVASLVCSIAGLLTGVTAFVGVALGFVARARIKHSDFPRRGLGLAMAQGSDTELTQASFFGGETGADLAQLARCVGMTPAGVDAYPVEAPSQAYSSASDPLWVNDTVDVFPTVAEAAKDAAASAVPGSAKCEGLTGSDLGPGFGPTEKDGTPEFLHRTLPSFGHLVADTEAVVPYSYNGSNGTFYNEWVTILVGRSESNLNFLHDGAPVPARMIDRLVRDAIGQMESQGA